MIVGEISREGIADLSTRLQITIHSENIKIPQIRRINKKIHKLQYREILLLTPAPYGNSLMANLQ